MAWGPFLCLFLVSCVHSKAPAIGYLMTYLHFLLCGCVMFFRVCIFRILAPREDLGTSVCAFVLGMTFLASVNTLHRLKPSYKAKQQPLSWKCFA